MDYNSKNSTMVETFRSNLFFPNNFNPITMGRILQIKNLNKVNIHDVHFNTIVFQTCAKLREPMSS